jgi:HEAT repeat protein
MNTRWLLGGTGLGFGLVVAALAVVILSQPTAMDYSLENENAAVRAAAIRKGVDEKRLIERLKDEDPDIRILAAQRLGHPGNANRASALCGALSDPHKGVRAQAMKSLAGMGRVAWPHLRDAMANDNRDARWGAVNAFTVLGYHDNKVPDWFLEHSNEIVPVIEKLLDDPDPAIRDEAKSALKIVRRKR